MAKKIFYMLGLVLVLTLISVPAVFAENKTTSTSLGNEITSSIDKTGKNMDNLVDTDIKNEMQDMGNTVKSGAENVGNTVRNGVDDLTNGIDMTNKNTENRAVAGTTGNYRTGDTIDTTNNNMSGTMWVWIIVAVIAIIIVAAVWYYVAQR